MASMRELTTALDRAELAGRAQLRPRASMVSTFCIVG